ncbi:uncharacterized protein DS421_18g621630 [Arachis hypogaea]|nr:uncharacterized protein DS421_18g621630 [Arachis hypogaea]
MHLFLIQAFLTMHWNINLNFNLLYRWCYRNWHHCNCCETHSWWLCCSIGLEELSIFWLFF